MDNEKQICELVTKPLLLTYQQYLQRGKNLQNLRIDHYLVSEKIGEGSYGSVFKGMDDNIKKKVAFKLIDLRQIKNLKSEYLREVQLRLAQSQPKLMHMCSSPYLMKCYQAYENEDLKVMILEFCEGNTLQAEIEQKKRIPQNEAWVILKHIINGLMELHRHRIVHRDLKAENIMSHNGTYKIIDFGFSKKLQIAQDNAEVKNTTLGTTTTMAPEVMGRRPYGLKADIWSLGIIFFQMCYGVYPYDSSNADKMYREVSNNKLFSSDEPFKFNGHTPSKEVHRFLRFAIVVETSKRPDWKEVVEFLKKMQVEDKGLNQRFLKRCEVVYDGGLDCSVEIKDLKQPTKTQTQPAEITTQPKKNEQNPDSTQLKLKTKEVSRDQDEQYEWVQNAHLQCLKTEFVFREIVNPLDITPALKKDSRTTIEFFYLLAARCFNNMSPIQDEIEERKLKGKKKEMVEDLSQQVSHLYSQVSTKFNQLSAKLTQSENKVKSMIFDWFSKKVNEQNFNQRDNFLTGIENVDYSKQDQIDFTFVYYGQHLKQVLEKEKNLAATVKRLENYQKLMKVKRGTLSENRWNYEQFRQFVLEGKK